MATFTGSNANETITPSLVSPTVVSFPLFQKPSDAIDVINANGGNDIVDAWGGNDSVDGGQGRDIIYGGRGNDFIRAGSEVDNFIANDDNDIVYGGAGNDTIYGGEDADLLFGEAGNDVISGGKGADLLVGGGGEDLMNGGDGFDIFDFNQASDSVVGVNRDVLCFDANTIGAAPGDLIDLRDVAPGSLTFKGTAAFNGINQLHVVNGAGSETIIQVNLAGNAVPEMEIAVLDGGVAAVQWSALDFML